MASGAISEQLAYREDSLAQVSLVHHSARPNQGQQLVFLNKTSTIPNQDYERVKRSRVNREGLSIAQDRTGPKCSRKGPKTKRVIVFNNFGLG